MAMNMILCNKIPAAHPTFTIHRRNFVSKEALLENSVDGMMVLQGLKFEANPHECVDIRELVTNSPSPVVPIAAPNALLRNQFVEASRRVAAAGGSTGSSVIFLQMSAISPEIAKYERLEERPKNVDTVLRKLFTPPHSPPSKQIGRGTQLALLLQYRDCTKKSDLDNLKWLAEMVALSRKQLKMWVFTTRTGIHAVEEAIGTVGYELKGIGRAQVIELINTFSGNNNNNKIGHNKSADELLAEYEDRVLSPLPGISNQVISHLKTCQLPPPPPKNPILYSFLLAKIFCQGEEAPAGLQSLSQLCAELVERYLETDSHFAQIIAKSCYSQFAGIILGEEEGLEPDLQEIFFGRDSSAAAAAAPEYFGVIVDQVASFLLALLLVDQRYEPIVAREAAARFIHDVVLAVEENKIGTTSSVFWKHPSLCHFVNSLLGQHGGEYFSSIMLGAEELSNRMQKIAQACVSANHVQLLKLLSLDDAGGDFGEELIGLAVMASDKETVSFLCEKYYFACSSEKEKKSLVDVRVNCDGKSASLLELAVFRGNYEITEYLLERFFKKNTNRDILQWAVRNSKFDQKNVITEKCKIVQKLVSVYPCVLNHVTRDGRSPLHMADIHLDLLKLLVGTLGANACIVTENAGSALVIAASYLEPEDYHEFVKLLAETNNAASFHLKVFGGNSALRAAITFLDVLPSTIHIFRAHGYDFNSGSEDGEDGLLLLAIMVKRGARLLDALIECGADPNVKVCRGDSLLHMAAYFGNLAAIRILVQRGIYVNLTSNGYTPLHTALMRKPDNLVETLRTLVECGADVHARCQKGRRGITALHLAVLLEWEQQGELGVVLAAIKYLVRRGARADAKDDQGRTMWDYALGLPLDECEAIAEATLK